MTDEEIRHGGVKGNVILSSLPLHPELPTPIRFGSPGDMAHPRAFSYRAACRAQAQALAQAQPARAAPQLFGKDAPVGSDNAPAAQTCLALPEHYMFLACSHSNVTIYHPAQQRLEAKKGFGIPPYTERCLGIQYWEQWQCTASIQTEDQGPTSRAAAGHPGSLYALLCRDLESYTSELAQQQEREEMITVNWEWSWAGSEPWEAPDFFHLASDSSSLVLCPCTHT